MVFNCGQVGMLGVELVSTTNVLRRLHHQQEFLGKLLGDIKTQPVALLSFTHDENLAHSGSVLEISWVFSIITPTNYFFISDVSMIISYNSLVNICRCTNVGSVYSSVESILVLYRVAISVAVIFVGTQRQSECFELSRIILY